MSKLSESSGLAVGFMVGAVVASMPIDAWVLKCLWDWFAVPAGATTISKATAFGLSILASFMLRGKAVQELEDKDALTIGFMALGSPAVAITAGYITHWFGN